MSFLNIFNKYNEIEKAVLQMYMPIMNDMGVSENKLKKMLDEVIKESKNNGTYYLPNNFGDIILNEVSTNNSLVNIFAETIRKRFGKYNREDVRPEDIKSWWNLFEIERGMIIKVDDINKMAMFLAEMEKCEKSSFSNEEAADVAAAKVKKYCPIYGDPDDSTQSYGDDRPLPFELKDRINAYIEKKYTKNQKEYKIEIEQSTSFNALVRKEIRAGNL